METQQTELLEIDEMVWVKRLVSKSITHKNGTHFLVDNVALSTHQKKGYITFYGYYQYAPHNQKFDMFPKGEVFHIKETEHVIWKTFYKPKVIWVLTDLPTKAQWDMIISDHPARLTPKKSRTSAFPWVKYDAIMSINAMLERDDTSY